MNKKHPTFPFTYGMLLLAIIIGCSSPKKTIAPGLWEAISSTPEASQFTQLIEVAGGLSLVLETLGKKTILVPTDSAFQILPNQIINDLKNPENTQLLTNVLRAHVIPGYFPTRKIQKGGVVRTAMEKDISYGTVEGQPTIDGAVILETIVTREGYIHLIDAVLKN